MLTSTDASSKSVLGRAFLLLECFRKGDETSLNLAELAARSGLPKSTVHRLATALVELGILERSFGNFSVGLHVFELGGLVPRWRGIRDAALPFMQELVATTRETVHLGLLDDGYVVYLDKIRGLQGEPVASRVGGRMPAHCTGLGKAILAHSTTDVVAAALDRPLEARTTYTITRRDVLCDQLTTIAVEGVAYDREEAVLGLACAAAPIVDYKGRAIAAISLSVPTKRFEPARLAPLVKESARRASSALRAVAYV